MGLYSGFPDRWPISLVFFREQEAEAWAELVWPSERGEEECLEEKPVETAGRQTQQPTYPVMQKQQQSPPPARPPSETLSDEQERLVAEIKRPRLMSRH